MKKLFVATLLTFALPLSVAQAASNQELVSALSGKTIVHVKTKSTIRINADGTMTGKGIKGTWKIKGRKWCRTLTEPKKFAGTECQKTQLDGKTITFESKSGRSNTYVIK